MHLVDLPPDVVRLPEQDKRHMRSLKRKTCVETWYTPARTALAYSLSTNGIPPAINTMGEDIVSIAWPIFGGEHATAWTVALTEYLLSHGLDATPENFEEHLRRHVHRGLVALVNEDSVDAIAALMLEES